MFKLLIILFMISSTLFAQEWINISPIPDNSAFVSGSFISSTEGWVINKSMNAGREIYYTSNEGNNWDMIYSFTDDFDPITSIFMIDSLNGWLTLSDYYGYNNFFNTSDGGYTWEDMTDYFIDVEDISSYYFIDENIGFISTYVYSDSLPQLYKTVNGGYTWESIEVPPIYLLNDPVNYIITTFFFLNDSTGWAGCHFEWSCGNVLYTSDAGENWVVMNEPLSILSSVIMISFYNELLGVMICYGCLFPYAVLTTNNCLTYTQLPFSAYAVNFQNDSILWVSVNQGQIYRSTDCGSTFDQEYQVDAYIKEIYFFNNIGYFFGSGNTLLRFTDQVDGIINNQIPNNDYSLNTFPNPFNPSLTINYSVPNSSDVEIEIYNTLGQKIKSFSLTHNKSGDYFINWNGKDNNDKKVSSGLYFVNLIVNNEFKINKKCLLIK